MLWCWHGKHISVYTNIADFCHHLCAFTHQKAKISNLSFCKQMLNHRCGFRLQKWLMALVLKVFLEWLLQLFLNQHRKLPETFLELTVGRLPALVLEVRGGTCPKVALEVILARGSWVWQTVSHCLWTDWWVSGMVVELNPELSLLLAAGFILELDLLVQFYSQFLLKICLLYIAANGLYLLCRTLIQGPFLLLLEVVCMV